MPSYVRTAEVLPAHARLELIDAVRKSAYVVSAWSDMKSIIKAVMIKHMNLFVRITSDNEIKAAYVGDMSHKAKGDTEATYENIGDFVGPPDLVIIRLNALTRSNKAAAGALEEALVHRADRDKPTWTVCDTSRVFNKESPAYSDSVWDVLSALPRVMVPAILPRSEAAASILTADPVDEDRPAAAPAQRSPAKRKPKDPAIERSDDDPLSMYGQGVKKSREFGRE